MRTPVLVAAIGLAFLGVTVQSVRLLQAQRRTSSGYVLHPDEGERIFGTSFIKVSPQNGAPGVAMALMRTEPNGRSGVHVHERADQIVLVVRGSGTVTLADKRTPISAGDTIYVPRGVWHEFGAGSDGMEAAETFVPAGVEQEFRETDQVSAGGKRPITLDQLNQIAAKYGSRYQDLGQ